MSTLVVINQTLKWIHTFWTSWLLRTKYICIFIKTLLAIRYVYENVLAFIECNDPTEAVGSPRQEINGRMNDS